MSNNENLFRELYNKYHTTMLHFCIGLIESKYDAEDYVQITFKLVWEKIDFIQTLEPWQQKKWIYTTLKNVIKDKEESRKKRQQLNSSIKDFDIAVTEEIEKWITEEQFNSYIKEIKEKLNDKEKKLFIAAFEHKLSYKALSKCYGKNVFSIGMQITRLRKKLKPIIEDLIKIE